MIGDGLLISPVLVENATTVDAYFPQGVWYNYYNHNPIVCKDTGVWLRLEAPIDMIQLHLRGGTIIPSQFPENTTAATRLNPFELLVPLNLSGEAYGFLYWDDGVNVLVTNNNTEASVFMEFSASSSGSSGQVKSVLSWNNFASDLSVSNVTVIGVGSSPSSATFNSNNVPYVFDDKSNTLRVIVNQPIFQNFVVAWQ